MSQLFDQVSAYYKFITMRL